MDDKCDREYLKFAHNKITTLLHHEFIRVVMGRGKVVQVYFIWIWFRPSPIGLVHFQCFLSQSNDITYDFHSFKNYVCALATYPPLNNLLDVIFNWLIVKQIDLFYSRSFMCKSRLIKASAFSRQSSSIDLSQHMVCIERIKVEAVKAITDIGVNTYRHL